MNLKKKEVFIQRSSNYELAPLDLTLNSKPETGLPKAALFILCGINMVTVHGTLEKYPADMPQIVSEAFS